MQQQRRLNLPFCLFDYVCFLLLAMQCWLRTSTVNTEVYQMSNPSIEHTSSSLLSLIALSDSAQDWKAIL
ncbi:unnamed protein product [Musa acuminata subsp. malaccensis]|uniref:(wild Malaysian banana) hypothetical protein n=1 Tax=Musa acuminata subsp. malaccensis TaxID=214687 RepID=A0A8D7B1F4_MUSAM|nr:unnamed protein product [Musa acuminata subsp. malaccensis]